MNGKLDAIFTAWFGASYRTTLAGALTVVVSIVLVFGTELGIPDALAIKITNALLIVTGGGLVVARDNRVTSERAGARPPCEPSPSSPPPPSPPSP